MTKEIKDNLDLILEHRKNCHVLQGNPYLFGIPNSSDGCIPGSDVLIKLSNICGAKSPHLLTSTKLRKHVATVAQIINLKYKDLDQLAKFMDHDIKIHREFYRMPEATVQIAKLGKLFLALDQGNISHLKNKTLDDIDVTIQEDEHRASQQEEDDDVDGTPSYHFGMEEADVCSGRDMTKALKVRKLKETITSNKEVNIDSYDGSSSGEKTTSIFKVRKIKQKMTLKKDVPNDGGSSSSEKMGKKRLK